MKKIISMFLAVVILATLAACGQMEDTSSNIMSESDIIALADSLMQKGQEVFWWYHRDNPDTLDLDMDENNRIQGDWQEYTKVGRFRTMAELKAATEAVFTYEFCETHFYDKINNHQKFHEIDGVLYYNLQTGGMGWILGLPKEYMVKTIDKDTIILTAICDGLDNRPGADGETEYEFEITLKNIGGVWRLNNWYTYSPEGWDAVKMVYRLEVIPANNIGVYNEIDIATQFEQVIDACADLISALEIDFDQGTYPLPTLEEYAQISRTIGDLGFPVEYYDLDMPNYDKVVAFLDDIQAGKDTQIVIFLLHNTGIRGELFESRDGVYSNSRYVWNFPHYGIEDYKPEFVFDGNKGIIENLHINENGHMLFYYPERESGYSDTIRGFRVVPLGDENREYTRKYVQGITDYKPGGLLRENWNQDDFSAVDMLSTFVQLYWSVNGDIPRTYIAEHIDDGIAGMKVPADEMENLMQNSLPITQEQLRDLIPYDESEKVYIFEIAFNSSFVLPEVVKAVKNTDGSLTLTIAATPDFMSNMDDIMIHELTAIDNPDGSIKYLSNVVLTPFE